MFAVLLLKKEIEVQVLGLTQELPMSFAEGMVGAIPVFESRNDAETYADGRFEVIEITTGIR